jgi:hypothetical protein
MHQLIFFQTGNFLLQNIKQAIDIKVKLGHKLKTYMQITRYGANNFPAWHNEEKLFLSTAKKKEPLEQMVKASYVKALKKLCLLMCMFCKLCLQCAYLTTREDYKLLCSELAKLNLFVNLTSEYFKAGWFIRASSV